MRQLLMLLHYSKNNAALLFYYYYFCFSISYVFLCGSIWSPILLKGLFLTGFAGYPVTAFR